MLQNTKYKEHFRVLHPNQQYDHDYDLSLLLALSFIKEITEAVLLKLNGIRTVKKSKYHLPLSFIPNFTKHQIVIFRNVSFVFFSRRYLYKMNP